MPARVPEDYDPPQHAARARELRRNATPEERKLWAYLRTLKPLGFHFRRQAPMGPFIADFALFVLLPSREKVAGRSPVG